MSQTFMRDPLPPTPPLLHTTYYFFSYSQRFHLLAGTSWRNPQRLYTLGYPMWLLPSGTYFSGDWMSSSSIASWSYRSMTMAPGERGPPSQVSEVPFRASGPHHFRRSRPAPYYLLQVRLKLIAFGFGLGVPLISPPPYTLQEPESERCRCPGTKATKHDTLKCIIFMCMFWRVHVN